MIKEISLNRQKQDNWGIVDEATELGYKNSNDLTYLGYDIRFKVEIDEESNVKLLEINGVDVSNKNIGGI